MSQTHSLTNSQMLIFFVHISVIVGRFGRSLWFCHLELENEAISDGFMAHSRIFTEWWGGGI